MQQLVRVKSIRYILLILLNWFYWIDSTGLILPSRSQQILVETFYLITQLEKFIYLKLFLFGKLFLSYFTLEPEMTFKFNLFFSLPNAIATVHTQPIRVDSSRVTLPYILLSLQCELYTQTLYYGVHSIHCIHTVYTWYTVCCITRPTGAHLSSQFSSVEHMAVSEVLRTEHTRIRTLGFELNTMNAMIRNSIIRIGLVPVMCKSSDATTCDNGLLTQWYLAVPIEQLLLITRYIGVMAEVTYRCDIQKQHLEKIIIYTGDLL